MPAGISKSSKSAKVVVKWRVWKLKRPLKGLWACPAPLHALAALAALAGPDDNEFGLHLRLPAGVVARLRVRRLTDGQAQRSAIKSSFNVGR